MNKSEFSRIAMAIKTYFPREYVLPNQQAIDLWYAELKDLDFNVASLALRKYVNTEKFPPTIADLRRLATECVQGQQEDWGKGWEATVKAIHRYGYYRQEEALQSLSELTRRTVERLGFKELCMSENLMNDRANFRMIYEQLANREKLDKQINPAITAGMNKILLESQQRAKLLNGGKE